MLHNTKTGDESIRQTMPSLAAAEYIGVNLSSLQRSTRTGVLFGLKAPAWGVVMVKSAKRILYSVEDLDRWRASYLSRPRKPLKKESKDEPGMEYRQPAAAAGSIMTFSAEAMNSVPLLVNVRHRTYLRALNLHRTLCTGWRYSTTADERILLRAVVSLPDGDAGYCHLADDTPAALSVAAEDLVVTLWRAAKDNPDAASAIATAARAAIATAARASIGPGAPEPVAPEPSSVPGTL